MKKYGRDRRPYIKPVTRVELSEKDRKKRFILAVAFLVIGAAAISAGLFALLNTQPGWVMVEPTPSGPNCSTEFTLMYDFTGAGSSATAENRRLNLLYTQAVQDGHRIFSPYEEGTDNLFALNAHVNEPVEVDPALYEAFALIRDYGDRTVFLAPVYVEYDRVFRSEGDGEAASYDPAKSEDARAVVAELAAFASKPQHVDVLVLENGRLQLSVSPEYLAYASENEIDTFLDFGWLRNAFVADYMASVLEEGGFTRGYLASFDGFTRNLDRREQIYSLNIFHKKGTEVYLPAEVRYGGPMAAVQLRGYPMGQLDDLRYHLYEDGSSVSRFIDPEDGLCKTAVEDLTLFSAGGRCAELAMTAAPHYISGSLSEDGMLALLEQGISCVWCREETVVSTNPELTVLVLEENIPRAYTIEYLS